MAQLQTAVPGLLRRTTAIWKLQRVVQVVLPDITLSFQLATAVAAVDAAGQAIHCAAAASKHVKLGCTPLVGVNLQGPSHARFSCAPMQLVAVAPLDLFILATAHDGGPIRFCRLPVLPTNSCHKCQNVRY